MIETKDNWNYSRGLLFTYAIPFYHFGLRAKYAFNDKFALTGYLVNGWNNIVDNNTGKTLRHESSPGRPTRSGTSRKIIWPGRRDCQTQLQLAATVGYCGDLLRPRASFLDGQLRLRRGDDFDPAAATRVVTWTGVAGYVRYAFNEQLRSGDAL